VVARFQRMESNVPQTLVLLRQLMGADPFRGLTEVGIACVGCRRRRRRAPPACLISSVRCTLESGEGDRDRILSVHVCTPLRPGARHGDRCVVGAHHRQHGGNIGH
jgi:hypothetical protein